MTTHTAQAPDDVPRWTVAHRLEMAREHAGLTQEQLREATGISRGTISAYEDHDHTGRRNPLYVAEWARACGVRLEWIWRGEIDLRDPDSAPGLQEPRSTWMPATAGHVLAVFPQLELVDCAA